MIIKLVSNRNFLLMLLMLLILLGGIFICFHDESDEKKVLDKLYSADARCKYYFDERFNKKLLSINVDYRGFQKVVEILPLLKEPYSIGIIKVELNQNDILKLSQNNMIILNLVECTSDPDWNILKSLVACGNLKELCISGRKTDMPMPIKSFNTVLQISSLRIVACNIKTEYFAGITDLQLENLDLTASNVPNECMSIVADCHSIKFLSLRMCRFYDGKGIRMISKMKNITELDLSLCHIPDKIFDSFIEHPSLKKIFVGRAHLNKDDIKLIEDQKNHLPPIIGISTIVNGGQTNK